MPNPESPGSSTENAQPDTENAQRGPESTGSVYDVIVIGAGPAGCEASLAAGRAGAYVLCLTINLDNVALHPAGPMLAGSRDDPRRKLLGELGELGGTLPRLLDLDRMASLAEAVAGRIIIDRRRLSLSYMEEVESAPGVELRQALVTGLEVADGAWCVETRLGERFTTISVVVATGTQLEGEVHEGGTALPGGRHGEVPSNSLAACLRRLGLKLERANATCYPRLDSRTARPDPSLLQDGSQLGELYAMDLEFPGSRALQLEAINQRPGLDAAWMMRSLFTVSHLILSQGQVTNDLQSIRYPGLFIAGRTAGTCNYTEAATLGLIAGTNAAAHAAGKMSLTINQKLVTKLCEIVAGQKIRPVTIRRRPPGC